LFFLCHCNDSFSCGIPTLSHTFIIVNIKKYPTLKKINAGSSYPERARTGNEKLPGFYHGLLLAASNNTNNCSGFNREAGAAATTGTQNTAVGNLAAWLTGGLQR